MDAPSDRVINTVNTYTETYSDEDWTSLVDAVTEQVGDADKAKLAATDLAVHHTS